MKLIKPDIPEELIVKWQKNVDLMTSVIGVSAGLVMKIYPLEVEVFLASATSENPYKKGQRFNLDVGLYSETVIAQRSQLLIPDARVDPQWANSPDVALGMISFLGLPLMWPDGEMFGILCVLDRKENHYSPIHRRLILQLKESIEADLNLLLKITEHKLAKEALEKLKAELDARVETRTAELKKAEEKYRQLVEKERDIIYTIDEEGIYTWINQAVEPILGYKPEELIGKKFSDLIPKEWQEKAEIDFRKLLETGELTAEITVLDKKGQIHFVEYNSMVIKEGGEISGARGIVRDITERKRVEDSLRESGERLKYILDSIPAGIIIVEPQRHLIVDANPVALMMIGVPKDRFIGSVCQKFICPPEKGRCPVTDLKQKVYDLETVLIKANGSTMPILKTVVPVALKDKEYLLEIFIDITKRKQAEEALRESEEKYRNIFERAPTSILVFDKDGYIIDVNPFHITRIGKGKTAKEDYIGKNIITHPSIVSAGLSKSYAKLFEGESFELYSVYFPITTGGTPAYLNIKGVPLFKEGKVIGAIALHEDITDIKKAEEALRSSEERFKLVASATFDAIWDWDLITDRIVWNEGLKTLFGYPDNEVGPDSNWRKERIHPEDREKVVSGIFSVINKGGKKWSDEYRFLRKDGSYAFVIDRGYVLQDEKGKAVRMIGAVIDVSERKKTEAELIQAQKLASIGQLAAGVAHEINNPLSVISGEIQWQLKRNKDKKLAKSLQLMNKTCDRIAHIVNNLLIFSREASTKVIEFSSIESLIEKTLLLIGRRLIANNIKITKKLKKNLPEIAVNRGEIEQALLNIFLNSLDAMPRGGKLSISSRLSSDREAIEITVIDTGSGIAKKDLTRVFDPFFTTKTPGKGAGLGLYLTHGIIKKHHGSIKIDSKLNRGTKISVRLPVKQPSRTP